MGSAGRHMMPRDDVMIYVPVSDIHTKLVCQGNEQAKKNYNAAITS